MHIKLPAVQLGQLRPGRLAVPRRQASVATASYASY
jgi:hypothetical protein